MSAIKETIPEVSNTTSSYTISKEKEVTVVPEKKKSSIGFGLNFDDIAKEIEIEETLKRKEKISVTEDHSCAVVVPEEKEETKPIINYVNTDELNEKNLEIVWQKMMNWFKTSEQMSLYELLFNNLPTIKEDNDLLLILDSSVEKEIIHGSSALIKGFLKRNFKQFNQLHLEVTTSTKSKKILLNQKDKYYLSIKKNPFLDKLRIELDLELEM